MAINTKGFLLKLFGVIIKLSAVIVSCGCDNLKGKQASC